MFDSPADGLERRRERVDRTRALTRGQLERLFARRDLPLRERTLWRLLYETAARANELLALDVEDLGPITDEGVAVGGAFDSDTATGMMPAAQRVAGVLASWRS